MSTPPKDSVVEPRPPVSRATLAILALAQTAIFIAFVPLLNFLLPLKAEAIDPAGKVVLLSQAALWGGVAGALANVAFGTLSDTTRTRFGHRRPWIALGLVLTLAAYAVIQGAQGGLSLILGVVLFQVGLNAMFGPLVALLPDLVPDRQKGIAAAVLGVAQPIATLFTSVVLAILVSGEGWRFGLMAGAVGLLLAPLLLSLREPVIHVGTGPRAGFSLEALKTPDFVIAFGSRLLVQVAVALNALYLLFYVRQSGPLIARFGADGLDGVFGWLLACWTATSLVAGVAGGVWSDRIGRRKVFVVVSGGLLAAGLAVMAAFPSWPGPLVGQALLGAGLGLFATVDMALVAQILPRPEHAGRDLGLINLANVLPQIVAPLLGILVFHGDGAQGFTLTYVVAAVFAMAGGGLIAFVRGVR
jgi:MFS family permease